MDTEGTIMPHPTQPRSITAVSRQDAYSKLEGLLLKSQTLIAKRLPNGNFLTIERMMTDVLTSISRTPKLLLCEPTSVIGTVLQAAEIGLRLNGFMGEAYMVPFWNSKRNRFEAQFQAGYRGFIKLAFRSGEVTKIEPRLVFTFDTVFEMDFGTAPRILHTPNVDHDDYGRRDQEGNLIGLRGAYAVCTYKDGHDFEYCNLNRLNELRARSQARDKADNEVGPWTTDPAEMYRKVPIRQLAKRLPLTSDDGRFQQAAMLDEYGDMGVAQNNNALVDAEPEFAGMLSEVVQDQTAALAAKHLPARPAAAPAHGRGTRPYQGRGNAENRRQVAHNAA